MFRSRWVFRIFDDQANCKLYARTLKKMGRLIPKYYDYLRGSVMQVG